MAMYKKKRFRSKSVKTGRIATKVARSELAQDLAVLKERANESSRSFESVVESYKAGLVGFFPKNPPANPLVGSP